MLGRPAQDCNREFRHRDWLGWIDRLFPEFRDRLGDRFIKRVGIDLDRMRDAFTIHILDTRHREPAIGSIIAMDVCLVFAYAACRGTRCPAKGDGQKLARWIFVQSGRKHGKGQCS